MKNVLSIMVMLVLLPSSWANLNIIDDIVKDPRPPKPAKDPVSGEMVKVELEEGYVYDRILATYNRTEGSFNHGWGFQTQVHYGELWQYKWKSQVLYAGDNYVVEYLDMAGNKAASSKMIVESKHELKTGLSDCLNEIINSQETDSIFGTVGRALFQTEFFGLKVKAHEGGETFWNKNDDVRAFRESFDFQGKQYLVIHDLKEGDPQIRRVVLSGTSLTLWKGYSSDANKNNRVQTKMLQNAILSLDRSLVPGDGIYEYGSVWSMDAKNLKRFITPYTRVDKVGGQVTFKTDTKKRKFKGEDCIKIFTTTKGEEARFDFVKQLRRDDKRSMNDWDHWHGALEVELDQFKAFIKPAGKHSFIHYLYSSSTVDGAGAKSVPWKVDPKLNTKINGETLYYCTRAKKKDRALRKAGLSVAKEMFEETMGILGEDCPW